MTTNNSDNEIQDDGDFVASFLTSLQKEKFQIYQRENGKITKIVIFSQIKRQPLRDLRLLALVKKYENEYRRAEHWLEGMQVQEEFLKKVLDKFTFFQWDDTQQIWECKDKNRRKHKTIKSWIMKGIGPIINTTTLPNNNEPCSTMAVSELDPPNKSSETPSTGGSYKGKKACTGGDDDHGEVVHFREKLHRTPPVNTDDDSQVRKIAPPSSNHNNKDTLQKLEHFVDVIKTNKDVQKYIEKKCNDSSCKSATVINESFELFLEKGNARVFQHIQQKYIESNMRIKASDIVDLLKQHVCTNQFNNHTIKNTSFLIRFDGKAHRAQPIHCDTKTNSADTQPEYFGIWYLTNNTPGTIYYNMNGVPLHPTIDDLTSENHPWHGLVRKEDQVTNGDTNVQTWICDYGRLAYATTNRRIDPGKMKKNSCIMMQGSHPHHAPASSGFRAVLFFSSIPEGNQNYYDGSSQMSKEKLAYMLYQDVPECESRTALLLMYAIYVAENIMDGGSPDKTFDYAQSKLLESKWVQLLGQMKDLHTITKERSTTIDKTKSENKLIRALWLLLQSDQLIDDTETAMRAEKRQKTS
jgi:hypothetical protein